MTLFQFLFFGQEAIKMKLDENSRKTHTVRYQPNSCDNKVEVRHFPKGIFLEFSCCSTDFTTHDLFIIFYHISQDITVLNIKQIDNSIIALKQ